ncbi:MAG: HD-GYP domain-containing protein [Clostridia bacterium]|nr:HD-GYP domain-containing protein [Clostridia bacterium]MDR3645064.1 HD-GYP domain-containing protein [Clostridia bacterium]
MILAKNLYGANNELLLAHGQRLIGKYILKLQTLGYQGVYIDDDLTKDIDIVNVIKDELRHKTISTVKNVYIYSKTGDQRNLDKSFDDTKNLVSNMVDEILNNKTVMLNMIDLKVFNDYTFYHSVNVAILAIVLGMAMGYSYKSLYRLGLGALLHDVGKVFVPAEILDKPSALTGEEFNQIKQHPHYGYEYLINNCVLPSEAYTVVLQHHERYNGSGYPYGLIGSKISRDGKIIAISDVYDAMVSDRPYRKALPHSDVIEYIIGKSETLFDPEVVQVFFKKIAPYPVGTLVQLSNGEKGIVLQNFESMGARPDIRIIDDENHVRDICLRSNKDYLSVTITGCEC